jgi:hypothetical protein
VRAWKENLDRLPLVKPSTIVRSLAIGDPADGLAAVATIKRTGGRAEDATDPEVLECMRLLAQTEGLFAETAGGTVVAAARKLARAGTFDDGGRVVLLLTGHGLKTVEALSEKPPFSTVIDGRLEEYRRVRGVLGRARPGGRAGARASLMRNVQVHKFGGASLADAPAFAHAVRIVGQQTGKLVVVVSAMSGTTDLLLEGAEKARVGDPKPLAAIADRLRKKHADAARVLVPPGPVLDAILSVIDASMTELATLAQGIAIVRELTPRTKDELVARGERLSAHLFSAALHATGHASAYVDALQVIRTDGQFGNAAPDLKATDAATRAILPLRARHHPRRARLLRATPDGQLATLGRGGTDVTAVLLGRAGRARGLAVEGRARPAHRGPAHGARRAPHPPAPRARGRRARLSRRQGAASARLDPDHRTRRARARAALRRLPPPRARRSPGAAP